MRGKTILVVDDSSTMCMLIARELEGAGYTVLTAENGMEAISMIEWMDEKPDLLTLDLDMPVMNGFEVCEYLRDKQNSPGQQQAGFPIVFIAANDTLENRRRGFQLGVTHFIAKPFKPHDIVTTINKLLSPRRDFAGMTALVIDDSSSVRRVIQLILMRIGVTVLTAANGLEAITLIDSDSCNCPLDIIITDYMMPEMRGDELCKLVRQKRALQQVPFLVVSAFTEKDLILSLFKAGATDYLCKPFIEEELLARVEIHLRARQYIKEAEALNKKLEYLASRDGLTELYNRRSFQELLAREFASARRYRLELSCIMLDLDFFKKINDTCGHAFGDLVLREFAALLRSQSRQADICARYGGEEFVVLLPHANLGAAILFAEKIRCGVEAYLFQNELHSRQATCSIGVASLKAHGPETGDKLVDMADQALYRAKSLGRNQAQSYSDELLFNEP